MPGSSLAALVSRASGQSLQAQVHQPLLLLLKVTDISSEGAAAY